MIDPTITAAVTDLAAQVTAAAPLDTASKLAISAIQEEGIAVLTSIDAAVSADAAALDAADPTGFPGAFPGALVAIATASVDQSGLCDMRGLVGRALFNLAQA